MKRGKKDMFLYFDYICIILEFQTTGIRDQRLKIRNYVLLKKYVVLFVYGIFAIDRIYLWILFSRSFIPNLRAQKVREDRQDVVINN